MKTIKLMLVSAALLTLFSVVNAAEKTVTLDVDNMTCMSCPYQVKSALKKVDGVIYVSASLDTQQAVVTFDDAVTTITSLTEATTTAGYPSRQVQEGS